MEERALDLLVDCHGIKKGFGEESLRIEVLHGIDLAVKPKELLMLVGPSGSGKTTLISIITGILSYDEGRCIILGADLANFSSKELTSFRGKNLGYVFQAFNLVPMLTAAENTAIPLLLNGEKRESAIEKARHKLAQFGLEKRADQLPTKLSGGEQQRVAIARAIIHEPKLIVCDEPTSALDQENGLRVLNHLREIVNRDNCSLIVVTHDSRIFEFADRILHIEDGKIGRAVTNNK